MRGGLGSTPPQVCYSSPTAARMGRGDITGKAGAKKSKTKGAVISFDEDARKSFLTGFRKRKNDRRQYARQKIAEQVRQEKLTARQERRVMQKEALAGASDDEEGSDAEPEGAEVSTYASGDALVTTVVEALLPDEDEKEEEEDAKLGRVGGPSYTAPKKMKKFNLSQPLSQAVPGYKPKVRACTGLAHGPPCHSVCARSGGLRSCVHGPMVALPEAPGPCTHSVTHHARLCTPLHSMHPAATSAPFAPCAPSGPSAPASPSTFTPTAGAGGR